MIANELRIGNLVQDIEYKSKWKVICFLGESMMTVDAGMVNFPTDDQHDIDIDKCEPVPLTEEWLLNFGFKKHEQPHLFFLRDFRFNLNTFTVNILRGCDKAGESQKHECGYPVLTDMISCGNVHQLQNLYFALTGTELEIQK